MPETMNPWESLRMRRFFPTLLIAVVSTTIVMAESAKTDMLEIHGRVLGPDGRPAAGVTISLIPLKEVAKPEILATSDTEGRYRLAVVKPSMGGPDGLDESWKQAKLVASVEGLGPDWIDIGKVPENGEWTPQLVKDDVPIEGAIADLGGQPLAGVTVTFQSLYATNDGSLDRFLADLKDNPFHFRERKLLPRSFWGTPPGVTPETKTDAQGRFRFTGIGRERLAMLKVKGPKLETLTIYALTRRDANLKALKHISAENREMMESGSKLPVIYPSRFHHLAAPSRPIVGTVRDKATKAPIPGMGVTIYSKDRESWAHVKTDQKGRYQVDGLPTAGRLRALAFPLEKEPDSPPYLKATRELTLDATAPEPVTIDFDLAKGILIQGRLTDAATGKPVRGTVTYLAFADNPFLKDVPEIGGDGPGVDTNADGSYTLVAIPGPGVLAGRADTDRFCAVRPEQFGRPADSEGCFDTAQMGLVSCDFFHHVVPVDPVKDAASMTVNIALDPGIVVRGSLVDQAGKPVEAATAYRLTALEFSEVLKDATFTATGLERSLPRPVWFFHPQRNLGRMVTLPGTDLGPLTVTLEPCGAFNGRIVDASGIPRPNVKVSASVEQKPVNWHHADTKTDSDGRFRITGLLTGLSYTLYAPAAQEINGLIVRPGEARDLGDIGPDTRASK
ncbi:hypothetical protein Sinac_6491 [Singulisphaera acidiphila DSM 18658]|uniref:Carboxypeptidase regulatory-like domain-containing protein n=2 Tax=Singulisphaera acidiphila TaxID=466153 RepID=L0DMT7_SINAD|nr:hypothetical protein Sinac_6491 [Singulisphaera acidiphila DSM 18658]